MDDKVTINIIGKADTGKTTIARLIEEKLRDELKFENVEVHDIPPSTDEKKPVSERVERMRKRKVIIRVIREG